MQSVVAALVHTAVALALMTPGWFPARAQSDQPLRQAFDVRVLNPPTPVVEMMPPVVARPNG